jgi:DNA-binding response OmpR family regulator/class 3 adenylate cyclase/predicted ATPase
MSKRILVFARSARLRESLVGMLASAGHEAEATGSANRAREVATSGDVALAILAPAALGGAGAALARDLAGTIGRLIVVGEQPAAMDRLAGLEFKADASLPDPVSARELLAHVATILDRDEGGREKLEEQALLTFEGFTLDIAGHLLIDAGGQEVPLSRAEFALLANLARRAGRVQSRGQLLGSMTRRQDDVDDRSVDVMVWRLRQKLEPNPKQPRLIVTVPGVGYKLAAKLQPTRSPAEPAAAAPAIDQRPTRPLPVERRHVTVLACGLVGIDALSSQLDLKEVGAVIGRYRRACSEIVARFGAPFARFSGNRAQFYFGYPQAHEHDAERAVRAGILIANTVATLVPGVAANLHTCIGIASGLVIVGDLEGDGATVEIVGEPPGLAVRLMSLAPPNAVLIAANTRNLLGGTFRYKQVGPVDVPGIPEPIAAWQVAGDSPVESRFDALRASRHSPMVGREEETALLLRRWRQSGAGDGRTVLICGEPGIGKSRLTKWLADRIPSEPHARLCYQCSPYHNGSALYPVVAQVERAAGFEKEDSTERRLDKLEDMLATVGADGAAAAPLLASLLSIPGAGRYQPLALSSTQQRRQTLAVLLELLAGLARRRPVLLIFEDVHWADATSLEWLDLAMSLARRMPIMMIITYRPEFKPVWSRLQGVSTLMLGRLEPHHVRVMIKGISRGRPLHASIIDRIVDQTDGIPLYVEELTRMVVDSTGETYGSDPDAAPPPLAIPLTLQSSLMARVDRLGSARELAQIAAVIGREFSYALVQQLAAGDESALARALENLEKSELVFRHGAPPEATYSFAHALVQEAAYKTLSKSRRRTLHRRIAELLCDPKKSPIESEPEVIAHHFTEAGLNEAAAQWWGKAGDLALRRSAYAEAILHFGKALKLAEGASGPEQLGNQLRLQLAYGQALIASRGHGQPETTAAFVRARELAARIESATERFSAFYGMWVGSFARAEIGPMRDLAEHFIRDVESSPDLPEAGVAHRVLGATRWFQGDYANALPHLEQAVAAYDGERDRGLAFRFGQDVGVSAMIYLAFALWPTGQTRRAHRLAEAAHALAIGSGHVPSIAYMHVHEWVFECLRGDVGRAMYHAEAAVQLSRKHGLPLWLASATIGLGWARWHSGDRIVGLAEVRKGLALYREQGAIFTPLYGGLQAECEAGSGQVETGLALVVDQLAEIERSGQRWLEAELHRRHAELFMQRAPADAAAAEGAFRRALGVARAQRASVFELRAAIGLARLYQSQSMVDAARDLLAPISGAWRENPDLPEAREARHILHAFS